MLALALCRTLVAVAAPDPAPAPSDPPAEPAPASTPPEPEPFEPGGDLWAADRRSSIPAREYGFVTGGSLGLCTAWDIVCVVGGSEYLLGVQTFATSGSDEQGRAFDPWGWHAGVGFDLLRLIARGNRTGS